MPKEVNYLAPGSPKGLEQHAPSSGGLGLEALQSMGAKSRMWHCRVVWILSAMLLSGCVTKPPVVAAAPPKADPQAAYRLCTDRATAATASITERRGAAESRIFGQCMAVEAPDDPAAMP
jgi:hypothetical protein